MYSYCLKAVENYKDIFKLIHITEIKYFNNCSYFYCVNNGINPLTVIVDLSKLPPVIIKEKSHAELLKEL